MERRPPNASMIGSLPSGCNTYLLVQKTSTDEGWAYFSIVQDMTVDPPLDYYAQVFDDGVRFEGTS
jgi:hypothetical protein